MDKNNYVFIDAGKDNYTFWYYPYIDKTYPLNWKYCYGLGNCNVTDMKGSNVIEIRLQSGQRIYERYCPVKSYWINDWLRFR